MNGIFSQASSAASGGAGRAACADVRRDDDNRFEIREAKKVAMCLGKQAHTRKTANVVVRETTKVKLESYKCPFCKSWHVGGRKEKVHDRL